MRTLRLGLALILVSGGAHAAELDWAKAEAVDIATAEYRFEPDRIELRSGVPYRLHFANHGKELHEFNAAALFRASELANPEVLNPDRTEIALHPGETKDLLLMPKAAGNFAVICPDHDWAGMTAEVVVR